MNKSPKVSIVIPTHNRKTKLRALVESILLNSYKNIEIIIVDDNSSDGTNLMIEQEFSDKEIIYIFNTENVYVATSRNIGIKKSSGKYIFLIDDDNILDCQCIEYLVQAFHDFPDASMVGPVMYYAAFDNSIWWAGTHRNMLSGRTKFIKSIDKLSDHAIWPTVDFPNAWMFKAGNKEILFDQTLVIHYEESDFAYRFKQEFGGNFYVVRRATLQHDQSVENLAELSERWADFKRVFYTARNRVIFHKRYSHWLQYLVFVSFWNPIFTIYYVLFILTLNLGNKRNNVRSVGSYIKGTICGTLIPA